MMIQQMYLPMSMIVGGNSKKDIKPDMVKKIRNSH